MVLSSHSQLAGIVILVHSLGCSNNVPTDTSREAEIRVPSQTQLFDIRGVLIRDDTRPNKPVIQASLSCRGIGDQQLGEVAELKELEELILFDNSVTGDGLQRLQGLQLQKLDLGRNSVDDKAGPFLAGIPSLRSLSLRECPVTDAILPHLRSLPKLVSLDLRKTKVTDDGMKLVAQMVQLEELELYDTAVTDAGIEMISKLPKLKVLNLNGAPITGRSLELLSLQHTLKKLSLHFTRDWTDRDLSHFHDHPHLEELSLYDTPATDQCIAVLSTLPKLRRLDVRMTEISEEGLYKLKQANRNVTLTQ